MSIRLIGGDCREVLATLPANSVHCVVTSPPYYGLRDYGTAQWAGGDAACDHQQPSGQRQDVGREQVDGFHGSSIVSELKTRQYRDTCGKCGATRVDRQIGLEPTPDAYLAEMVRVFREVRRVLRPDGTCWVNMGDSYASNGVTGLNVSAPSATFHGGIADPRERRGKTVPNGLKPKDLLMMPARLALALQADGWWLRSDIIWHKPNPMPESVTDRPTSSHEHVFLLAKAARYFYDADAVRETAEYGVCDGAGLFDRVREAAPQDRRANGGGTRAVGTGGTRNLRNVWTIATHSFAAAHFATYPPALAERCIRAGTKLGDTVLDPFAGAGTTLLVADRLQRDAIGIELSPDYTRMAMDRCRDDAPLFAEPSPPPAEPPEEPRIRDLFA